MTQRKILISGATGFIGRQLIARLLAAGYHISAFRRNGAAVQDQGVSWITTGDLAATPIDPVVGRGFDTFINLAAPLRPTSREGSGDQSQAALIARNVSSFVSEAGIPRVLVLSSIAASLAERVPGRARRYGVEKLAADRIFLETLREGHQVVLLRPPAVYGPGMKNSMAVLAKLVRSGLPIPLGSATESRSYISSNNLCDLITTIVGSDDGRWSVAAGRSFEPSDGPALSTRDLVRMIGEQMDRKPLLLPVPLAVLRALGAASGRSELVSGAVDRLETRSVAELEEAFGWRPAEKMPTSLAFLRG